MRAHIRWNGLTATATHVTYATIFVKRLRIPVGQRLHTDRTNQTLHCLLQTVSPKRETIGISTQSVKRAWDSPISNRAGDSKDTSDQIPNRISQHTNYGQNHNCYRYHCQLEFAIPVFIRRRKGPLREVGWWCVRSHLQISLSNKKNYGLLELAGGLFELPAPEPSSCFFNSSSFCFFSRSS